jgi:hypothetical protein
MKIEIKMLKYFLTTLFYLHFLYASEFEEFYIFPMGQGNSQLIVYHNETERIGVLYDLGSKSLQMHPKFAPRGRWDKITKDLLKEKRSNKNKELKSVSIPVNYKYMLSTPSKITESQEPVSLNAKLSTPQREIVKSELQTFIKKELTDLKHLFIFLSHSDEDHINFINSKSIPNDVPITIFLAGDWFGNVGCAKNKTNITKAVKGVLAFLRERMQQNPENTYFNFPYYNNFSITKNGGPSIDFNVFVRQSLIDREVDSTLLEELSNHCLKTNFDAPVPEFFSGSFTDLYNSVFLEASAHVSTSHGLMTAAAGGAPEDFEDYVKRHIHIWSLNHQTDDINGHSMVVSCTLPTLNMSIVLTGDALHSVFQRIASQYRGQDFRQILESKYPTLIHSQHIVTFMLPHHASEENSSGVALRFFTPDVFGIPAGDGGQYGHPSFSLIQGIKDMYDGQRMITRFYQRFALQKNLDFIAIHEDKHVLVKATGYTPPFLSPNLYGCIKWDKSGIYTNFDNIVDVRGDRYSILYSSHTWEANKGILKKMKKGSKHKITALFAQDTDKSQLMDIVEKSSDDPDYYKCIVENPITNELFAGVPVDDKLYFYKLIRTES